VCLTPGDLRAIATRYLAEQAGERAPAAALAGLSGPVTAPSESFCLAVADYYDRAPRLAYSPALGRAYATFKRESMAQYRLLAEAGLVVEPWLGPGQPYRDSQQLRDEVCRTGALRLFLTQEGHGRSRDECFHPLREPANLRLGGAELVHNDIYRIVHDLYGHVMLGASMGPSGEFLASYCHLLMYSPGAHQVLFAEQISQICWFFYGPHLRDRAGKLPEPGDSGWIPLHARPYPEQKVFACPPELIDEFMSSFEQDQSSQSSFRPANQTREFR
jgi:hypothetical protein